MKFEDLHEVNSIKHVNWVNEKEFDFSVQTSTGDIDNAPEEKEDRKQQTPVINITEKIGNIWEK